MRPAWRSCRRRRAGRSGWPPAAAWRRRARAARGSVAATIFPPEPNAISLPVWRFSCAASASSSRKPTVSRPRISGGSPSSRIGTLTSCRRPSGCVQNIDIAASTGVPATSAGSAAGPDPAAARIAPLLPVRTKRSALISVPYSSASGCTVGESPVATAALSFGRSATRRASRVNVSVSAARFSSTRVLASVTLRRNSASASLEARALT